MTYTLKSGKTLTIPDDEIAKLQSGLNISYTEAVKCWLDDWAIDHEQAFNKLKDEDKAQVQSAELVALDNKAKGYRRENAKSEKKHSNSGKPRTVHVADEKVRIFSIVKNALASAEIAYTVEKENKLIHAKVGDVTVKIDFVELGKYKKGGVKK